MRRLLTVGLNLVAALLATAARAQVAQGLDEAELFFELNDTDGDLGLHASIDGGPWTSLTIYGPGNRVLLSLNSRAEIHDQGLTQLSFESAEPSFDDLDPARFFARFPEGVYRLEARSMKGTSIDDSATLSHVLAAPPANVRVNRSRAARSCDEPLPAVITPVTIAWDPVTRSHPTIGKAGSVDVSQYQLFVEGEDVSLGFDLPPTITEFEIPERVTKPGGEFKFEIIVRTSAGNNTAVESCFEVLDR